jgi:5-methylcytosine-specific restriction endonuclease McrA
MPESSVPILSLSEKRKAKARAYYRRHREERKAYGIKYYARKREQALAYYYAKKSGAIAPRKSATDEEIREKRRNYAKSSYHKIKDDKDFIEKRKKKDRKYKQSHKEKIRIYSRNRRAKMEQITFNDLTDEQWIYIVKAYKYICVYCLKKFKFNKLTRDHLTPISHGGAHTVSNIVPACLSCNARKGTRGVLRPVQPLLLSIT